MFTFNGFLAKLKTKFSTNKTPTSSHRFPLVLSDGTPDGNATAADVQAFLGADSLWLGLFPKRGEVPNNDFNNAIPYGIYYAMNTTDWTNGPVPKDQCIMLCYGWQINARTIQVAICVGAVSTNNAGVYIRIYKQGMEPPWSEWIKL